MPLKPARALHGLVVAAPAATRMPKIRRRKLPEALLTHLVARIRERNISAEQIVLLARWLDTEPVVPEGKWFKRFAGF
jgi:ribosomal protein S18 acetylase RimI-like enzyme